MKIFKKETIRITHHEEYSNGVKMRDRYSIVDTSYIAVSSLFLTKEQFEELKVKIALFDK